MRPITNVSSEQVMLRPFHPRIPFHEFDLFQSNPENFFLRSKFSYAPHIKKGISRPITPPNPELDESTQFSQYVISGNIERVERLLAKNRYLGQKMSYYFSCPPIQLAMEEGHWDIVSMMINKFRVNPTEPDLWGLNSFHYSAIHDALALQKLLNIVKPHEDYNIFDAYTSRMNFKQSHNPDPPPTAQYRGSFSSQGLSKPDKSDEIFKLSSDDIHYKYIHSYDISGQTPLHLAALYQNFDSMLFLLDAGADPEKLNAANQSISTFLVQNSTPNSLERVQQFLKMIQKQSRKFIKNEDFGDGFYTHTNLDGDFDGINSQKGAYQKNGPNIDHNEPIRKALAISPDLLSEIESLDEKSQGYTPEKYASNYSDLETEDVIKFGLRNKVVPDFEVQDDSSILSEEQEQSDRFQNKHSLDSPLNPSKGGSYKNSSDFLNSVVQFFSFNDNNNKDKETTKKRKIRASQLSFFSDTSSAEIFSHYKFDFFTPNPLWAASDAKNTDMWKYLLPLFADLSVDVKSGDNILHKAAKFQDALLFRYTISHFVNTFGLDVVSQMLSQENWSGQKVPGIFKKFSQLPDTIQPAPLHQKSNILLESIKKHDWAHIESLLDIPGKKTQLQEWAMVQDLNGNNALHQIAIVRHFSTLKRLLRLVPDPTIQNNAGNNFLHVLFMHLVPTKLLNLDTLLGDLHEAGLLVKLLSATNNRNLTPIDIAAAKSGYQRVLQKLLTIVPDSPVMILHSLARSQPAILDMFLSTYPDHAKLFIHQREPLFGNTPYLSAVAVGHQVNSLMLKKIGENPRGRNFRGETAFHLASAQFRVTVDKWLSFEKQFAPVQFYNVYIQNAKDLQGRTVFHSLASLCPRLPIPQEDLHQLKTYFKDSFNYTGTSASKSQELSKIGKIGGKFVPAQFKNQYPISSNNHVNQFFILYYLLHIRKLSAFVIDNKGKTPLHYLAMGGARESVRMMLHGMQKNHPDEFFKFLNVEDHRGNTALASAIMNNHFSVGFIIAEKSKPAHNSLVNGIPLWMVLVDKHQWSFIGFVLQNSNLLEDREACEWLKAAIEKKIQQLGGSKYLNPKPRQKVETILSLLGQSSQTSLKI